MSGEKTRVEAIHPACRTLRGPCCGANHLRPSLYDWLVDQYLAALVKRLKVVNHKINEIERVLARNLRADRMENLVTARPALLADVPASERTSREIMLNAADSYFEAIEHGQGGLAPFAEDCERHENGGQTTHNKAPVGWPVTLGTPEADHAMAVPGTDAAIKFPANLQSFQVICKDFV